MFYIKHILHYDGLNRLSGRLSGRFSNPLVANDGYQYASVPGRQLVLGGEYEVYRTTDGVETKIANGVATPLPAPRSHKLGVKLTNITTPVVPGDVLKPKLTS